MDVPYFFIEHFPAPDQIVLPEEASKHLIRVLRMKTGGELNLADGKGNLITARITHADRKHCAVAVEQKNFIPAPQKKISIAISLLKNSNRFEWFLEKSAEIGVSEIIPMICERTEKQYIRLERMRNILISAMLQSRQAWLPLLHEPKTFASIVDSATHHQKLIAHCGDREKNFISGIVNNNEVQILIGPEGDFTSAEIQMALEKNFKEVSLGSTRLRSETAGVIAAALLMNNR